MASRRRELGRDIGGGLVLKPQGRNPFGPGWAFWGCFREGPISGRKAKTFQSPLWGLLIGSRSWGPRPPTFVFGSFPHGQAPLILSVPNEVGTSHHAGPEVGMCRW